MREKGTVKMAVNRKAKRVRNLQGKMFSETAKVLKMAPVVQKCFFVPLEL